MASVLAVATAAPAEAGAPFSLGSAGPGGGGEVHGAVDGAGTLHAAWLFDGPEVRDEKVRYCRVPRGAQGCADAPQELLPPGGSGDSPFVLVDGATIYVVVHRYVEGDVLLWQSTGGGPFVGPSTRATGTSGTYSTEPVFGPVANTITIGTSNPGSYVQNVPLSGAAPSTLASLDSQGFIYDFQVGLSGTTPIAVGWKIPNSGRQQVAFFRHTGASTTAAINTGASWSAPNVVADGADSRLAGGPSGLFLLTSSYRPGATFTDQFQVRKFDGSAFGAPVNVGPPEVGAFPDLHQTPSGALLAAWRLNDDPNRLRLSVSTNGGASFAGPVDIAREDSLFRGLDVAAAADGQGFAVWKDEDGAIRAASLEPLPQPAPPPGPGPGPGPVAPRAGRVLELDASRNAVRAGRAVQLRGKIEATSNPGACQAAQPVEVQQRTASNQTFVTFAQVVSDQNGTFATTIRPRRTAEYRALVRQTDACLAEASNDETVAVPPVVSVVTRSAKLVGRTVRFQLRCPRGGQCAGTVKLRTADKIGRRGSRKRMTLGAKAFQVPANRRRTTQITVSPRIARALRTRSRVRLNAFITNRDQQGRAAFSRDRFTLRTR